MSLWNLGSVATEVLTLVDSVPTSLSGLPIEKIADRQREFCQNYTGQSIGSNSINIDFQGPVLNLTISKVTSYMNLQGSDAKKLELGDLNVEKGGDTNLKLQSEMAKDMAMDELRIIGRKRNFGKANG